MRSFSLMAAALFALALATGAAEAAGPHMVVDAATGEVLSSHGADVSWHPASLTKMMTARLAFAAAREGRLDMSSPVTMSPEAASKPPSKLGLPAGRSLPLRDALSIMLTRSANDVAAAIGETLSGTEEAFAEAMTAEARRLGMTATRFSNASGLHDDRQVTTARDMAVLALSITREFPEHASLFGMRSYGWSGRSFRNTNGLLSGFAGADGMKTGYVCASGFNVVASATRGGRRLLAVVLGHPSTASRDRTAGRLLEAGFMNPSAGPRITGHAISGVRPGTDMRPFSCGKTWRGLTAAAAALPERMPLPEFRRRTPAHEGSPLPETTELSEGDGRAPARRF